MKQRWPLAEEMFPSGIVLTNEGPMTIEDLRNSNADFVSITFSKPIRDVIESQNVYTYYENGSLEIEPVYSIYPFMLIDGRSTLNVYAQKINNDWIQNNMACNNMCEEGEMDDESGFDYSQL